MAASFSTRTAGLACLAPAVALYIGLNSGPGAAADQHCLQQAQAQLTALGIAPSNVENVSVVTIVGSREIGNVLEYQAWATLRSCTGSIVTRMSHTCRVIDTYARGDCQSMRGGAG